MLMLRACLGSLALSLVLSLASAGARAATITIDDPAFQSLLSSSAPAPLALAGTLPAFDTALGTLTGVTLGVIGSGSAFLTLDVSQAGLYAGPLGVSTTLVDGSGVHGGHQATMGTIRGTSTGAGSLLLQDGNAWLTTIEITSGLTTFLSAGAYDVVVDFFGAVSGPGMPSMAYAADGYAGSAIVDWVTFTYTPIPEPSTGLLVGVGLAAAAWRRSRLRAR